MLIDAHIHSKGISLCSRLSYREMLDQCAEDSVDGIVLTNHLKENYIGKEPYSAWKERYVEEYNAAREYGASIGVTVLFGVEVTLSINPVVDYALYGIDEQEFLHSPVLYALSQRELFTYCTDRSALLIQAHPYRNGAVPQDPRYLHGVEINCHPLYKTNEQTRVTAFARKHGLLLTCGSDYHGDTYKPHCGVEIPDGLSSSEQFADCLRSNHYSLVVEPLEHDLP